MSWPRLSRPVLAGALALTAIAVALIADRKAPPRVIVALPAVDLATAQAPCDLNLGPCGQTLADGVRGQLELSPRPIAVMQPLQVLWREVGDPPPAEVHLAFEGVEMEMGFNRVTLRPEDETDGSTRTYRGVAMLPVCTTGSMRWRAHIDRGAGRAAAQIEFTAPPGP